MAIPEPERLLSGAARARLPLARQLLLYLDPFALFADASRGPAATRARALSYNRAMRWMLLGYLRRWTAIAGASFLGAQAASFAIPSVALAAGFCLAFTVAAVTAAVYILLGAPVATTTEERKERLCE